MPLHSCPSTLLSIYYIPAKNPAFAQAPMVTGSTNNEHSQKANSKREKQNFQPKIKAWNGNKIKFIPASRYYGNN
jgi:hypothetical protein